MSTALTERQGTDVSSGTQVEADRAIQQVQAGMTIAKRFPRDEDVALQAIIKACGRVRLAENSQYEYARGGTPITGPSIRLAEMLAQYWGNLDYGVVELEQNRVQSTVMAYCWDLETNVRQIKTFVVEHTRHTRNGTKSLTDPRDRYENLANQAARRLRACILGVIPGDVVDSAVEACNQTLSGGNNGKVAPLKERIAAMVAKFAELQVTQEMLEERLQHDIGATSASQLAKLAKVYSAIKDGFTSVQDEFNLPQADPAPSDQKVDQPPTSRADAIADAVTPPVGDEAQEEATRGAETPDHKDESHDGRTKLGKFRRALEAAGGDEATLSALYKDWTAGLSSIDELGKFDAVYQEFKPSSGGGRLFDKQENVGQ